ncbi:2-methylisocitrate lyase-like PEP mutase family enzyme [Kitasatospora sp. MAP12-15]|uniref:isocitrate lyase/PEP mutase family protein n=1 Tax=unclassified Kitasatospora TaxID=2633591 RepID=UPI002474E641|nr:isocitrate lyase/phosphoenolpyruvate mutase family protein [Kitasatospora sp. MAP12-44]MDH6112165.1 2-methylisocitrate lyase-like PEP mutase family enzyme [Kitasatospora sp. MAP12-44]
MSRRDKAVAFGQLHVPGRPLVLANVWDPGTARVVAAAGAAALATTSAGVSWGLGVPDGEALGREQTVELTARVAAAVDLPVTADLEGGYGATPEEVAQTVRLVLAAGAIGINLEDGLHGADPGYPPGAPLRTGADQAARIAAVRAAAEAEGIPLFVNARIDTYLRQVGDRVGRLDETLARARAYAEAGADGVFVPGVAEAKEIAALTAALPLPLNVMVHPGSLSVPELAELGVARVSVGAGLALAALGLVRRAAAELFADGTYDALAGDLSYPELNALLS